MAIFSVLPLFPKEQRNQYVAKPARNLQKISEFLIEKNPVFKERFAHKFEMSEQEKKDCRKDYPAFGVFNIHIEKLQVTIPPQGRSFDTENEDELLELLICMHDMRIAKDPENSSGKQQPLFYISNPTQTISEKKNFLNLKLNNLSYANKLSYSELLRLGRKFSINTKDRSEDEVKAEVLIFADTKVIEFNDIITRDPDVLSLELDILELVDYQIIEVKKMVYFYNDEILGNDIDAVVVFLQNKKNRGTYDEMMMYLKKAKSGNYVPDTTIKSDTMDATTRALMFELNPDNFLKEDSEEKEDFKEKEKTKGGKKKKEEEPVIA